MRLHHNDIDKLTKACFSYRDNPYHLDEWKDFTTLIDKLEEYKEQNLNSDF